MKELIFHWQPFAKELMMELHPHTGKPKNKRVIQTALQSACCHIRGFILNSVQIPHGGNIMEGTWLIEMKRVVPTSVYLIILGREFSQSAPLCLMVDITPVRPSINSDTFSNTQILKKGWLCEISYSHLICWVGWGKSLSLQCFPVPCSSWNQMT